jgi:GcrA cell cycle regulator
MSDVWEKKEGMLDRLKQLCADPDSGSFSMIADRLSHEFKAIVSRNAVIGKVRRLGIKKNSTKPTIQAPRIKKPPAPTVAKQTPTIVAQPRQAPVPQATMPARATPALERDKCTHPDGVHILDLREHHCRFTLWGDHDSPSLMFCGEKTAVGPYSAGHARLSYPNLQARRHAQAVYARAA